MDLNGDVLSFLAIAAESYSAKATVTQFVNNVIATCIAQAIAKMDRLVSTRLVVLEILNTILAAC